MADDANRDSATRPAFARASEIPREDVEWIWPGRVARGKLTIIAGDPGAAKTTIAIDVAARLSRGTAMPDDHVRAVADVLFVSAEDGAADTLVPRLIAAGADLSRVHIHHHREPLSLPGDVETLAGEIERTGAVLVILDPLSALLTVANSFRVSDVRRALAPVVALAERTRVALVAIEHLNKDVTKQALYRTQGSIAFVAAARIALVVGPQPGDVVRRVLAVAKCNLAPLAGSLAYSAVDCGGVPAIEWHGEVALSADDVLAGPVKRDRRTPGIALASAEDCLRAVLADGPVRATIIEDVAREQGVSGPTIGRAKTALGVRSERRGDRWWWWIYACRSAIPLDVPTGVCCCGDVPAVCDGCVPPHEAGVVTTTCAATPTRCDAVVLAWCGGDT